MLAAAVLLPTTAHAHSPLAGAHHFINGLLHPLTTPAHVLLIVGLGLMAGRQATSAFKPPFIAFAALSALALGVTTLGWSKQLPTSLLLGVALVPAALLALESRPPLIAATVLFAAAAILLGLDSAVEGRSGLPTAKILFGNWLSLNVLVLDVAIYTHLAGQATWIKIGLRVIGSWIIAIGLMVLAFSFRR